MDFVLKIIEFIGTVVKAIWTSVPFSGATWMVLALLGFFVWLFKKADADPDSPIQWEHLIVDSETNRASPYKLGYLLGLIVATWIVIRFVDAGTLNWDIFGGYLMYLLGGAGVSTWKSTSENKASIAATGTRPGLALSTPVSTSTPTPTPSKNDVIN